MKKQYLLLLSTIYLAMTGLLLSITAPLMAQSPEDPDFFALKHLFAGAGISQDQAAALVLERYSGRILDVRAGDFKGRSVYLFKILMEDSRVLMIAVDQSNGQILQ